jgi:2-methylaconitate cis-trans-isomerase PrpF
MLHRGSKTGKLLPTGNITDTFVGIKATCIDAGNPAVFIQASDIGVDGTILPEALDSDTILLSKLESIRRKAGVAMGLGPTEDSIPGSIPKIAMISKAASHKLLSGEAIDASSVDVLIRALSVGQPHRAVPLTLGLAAASAANLKGSIVHSNVATTRVDPDGVTLGHPSGKMMVGSKFNDQGTLTQGIVFRTARRLMEGQVYWK